MPGDLDRGGSGGEPLVFRVYGQLEKRLLFFRGICRGTMEQGGMHITEPLQFFDGSASRSSSCSACIIAEGSTSLHSRTKSAWTLFQSFSVIQTL